MKLFFCQPAMLLYANTDRHGACARLTPGEQHQQRREDEPGPAPRQFPKAEAFPTRQKQHERKKATYLTIFAVVEAVACLYKPVKKLVVMRGKAGLKILAPRKKTPTEGVLQAKRFEVALSL